MKKLIRLRKGAKPACVSGYSNNGAESYAFPTEERQRSGWKSKDADGILSAYPSRYELVTDQNKAEVN